jgi:hypothetical protein
VFLRHCRRSSSVTVMGRTETSIDPAAPLLLCASERTHMDLEQTIAALVKRCG